MIIPIVLAVSDIEWTDKVWNPVRGCSLVSQGCKNCYAMRQARRMSGPGQPYEGLTVLNATGPTWTGKVICDESKLDEPLHWKKPCHIFVNSMSDLFHEDVPDSFIARIFGTMSLCPEHMFQVLTKRPERMSRLIDAGVEGGFGCEVNEQWYEDVRRRDVVRWDWPLPNVWPGVSFEDQKTADERIPRLLQTPAAVLWGSYEPALGPVDLTALRVGRKWDSRSREDGLNIDALRGGTLTTDEGDYSFAHLDWLVCGGESGPGARPMHPDWARSVRDQCVAAGVPFFFKQWGDWARWQPGFPATRVEYMHRDGRLFTTPSAAGIGGEPMVRVGKKVAGRLLDGREWNEYPKPATRDSKLETDFPCKRSHSR